MRVRLTRPEIEAFVVGTANAGDFPSADAVVGDALARIMRDEAPLAGEDAAEISRADDAMDRGEGVDFDTFAARMRAKYPAT